MVDKNIFIRIGADAAQAKREFRDVQKGINVIEKDLKTIATASGVAFGVVSAAIIGTSKSFAEFQNQLKGTETLLINNGFSAKEAAVQSEKFGEALLDTAKKIPVEIESLNKALFDTVSALGANEDTMKTVEASSRLAVAGLTDVAITTDGLTSAMGAYGEEVGTAEEVSAKFFTTQQQGKTTIEEIAGGIGLVASNAKFAGVSLDELLAATAAATAGGIKTNAAFTGMKAAISNILKPSKRAVAEAKRLGIEFDANALKTKGLNGIIGSLANNNNLASDSFAKLFESTEAQTVIGTLATTQFEKFTKVLTDLEDTQKNLTTLQEAYAVQSVTLANQTQILKNKLSIMSIEIGKQLAPFVEKAISLFVALLDKFSDPIWAKMAARILAITAALTGFVLVVSGGALAVLKLGGAISTTARAVKNLSLMMKLVGKSTLTAISSMWSFSKSIIGVARSQGIARAATILFNGALRGMSAIISANHIGALVASIVGLVVILQKAVKWTENLSDRIGKFKTENSDLGKAQQNLNSLNERANEIQQKGGVLSSIRLGNIARKIEKQKESISLLEKEKGIEGVGVAKEEESGVVKQAEKEASQLVEIEDKKGKAIEDKRRRRIEDSRAEIALLQAERMGAGEEELNLLKQTLELQKEEKEASLIADDELRALEFEKISLQKEKLAELQARFDDEQAEKKAEFRELQLENEDEIAEEDLQRLTDKILTEQEIKEQLASEEAERQIDARNKFLKNEAQFGKNFANLMSVRNSGILKASETTAQALIDIESMKSNKLAAVAKAGAIAMFAIRKVQAISDILISGQQGKLLAQATVPPPGGQAIGQAIELQSYVAAALVGGTALANLATGNISGARQAGGPVIGGSNYLVGEAGPEIFTAPVGGEIISNENVAGALGGGGTTINNTVNVEGGVFSDETITDIMTALDDKVRYDNATLGNA